MFQPSKLNQLYQRIIGVQDNTVHLSDEDKLLACIEAQPKRLLLLTDFDGTVSNLHPEPMQAFVNPAARTALIALKPRVVFVTGRDVVSLNTLLNTQHTDKHTFTTIAEHGLKQYINGTITSALTDTQADYMLAQQQVAIALAKQIVADEALGKVEYAVPATGADGTPTVETKQVTHENLVETSKQGSLCFHYRVLLEATKNKPDAATLARIKTMMRTQLEHACDSDNKLTIIEGDMNFELNFGVTKGAAVDKMINAHFHDANLLLFACDDLAGTDGSAAEAVHRRGGIVIQVLNDKPRYTDAARPGRQPDVTVASPEALAVLLDKMQRAYQRGLAAAATTMASTAAAAAQIQTQATPTSSGGGAASATATRPC